MKTAIASAVLATALAMGGGAAAADQEPTQVVGWIENVKIPALGIELAAKNDTGAESASLHAEKIEEFEKDGDTWYRFEIVVQEQDNDEGKARKTIQWEAPSSGYVLIKQKGAPSKKRPMIELDLCMGHVHRRVEVNLADRSGFSTRLLLGREFLRGAALVDSSESFMREPLCVGPAEDAVDD
jgi:hypothetical protein